MLSLTSKIAIGIGLAGLTIAVVKAASSIKEEAKKETKNEDVSFVEAAKMKVEKITRKTLDFTIEHAQDIQSAVMLLSLFGACLSVIGKIVNIKNERINTKLLKNIDRNVKVTANLAGTNAAAIYGLSQDHAIIAKSPALQIDQLSAEVLEEAAAENDRHMDEVAKTSTEFINGWIKG